MNLDLPGSANSCCGAACVAIAGKCAKGTMRPCAHLIELVRLPNKCSWSISKTAATTVKKMVTPCAYTRSPVIFWPPFGIVLWELFTCGSPFRGVPPALLGHSIVKDCKRPAWPPVVPSGYKDLANACWDQNPDARCGRML
ncbi:hypothetical protein DUNSADRAFT_11417 [Dunaliella salina]|uniref:Serine-threonine/tyrosine-protein kinase catalytic domain-containing protein n=1 Tax=Dunaliella salina TaxID=3046 RepID=A0ABQ7GDE7_DUNSA|nr:hypothetical protein DUNSADRAFT_11417 [Dunaliella salina]|eukprot:KAF5832631.1 hypothetical protein DUNSADRAFT_11417 [Dunaliella salina]